MAMIPRLHISTLGPYSLWVTTSGAIQYGDRIVVRFAEAESESCAQNPKSAVKRIKCSLELRAHLKSSAPTEFDIARHTQEHIVTLDIPMNNAMPMQMFQTLRSLPRYSSDLSLRHQIRSDHIRQWTTLHVLHDNPQVIFVQEWVYVVDYIGMARGPHDQDLDDNEI